MRVLTWLAILTLATPCWAASGNRVAKERLDFVYHIAFPPSHAELLPVRESKEERSAYEAQLREEETGGGSRPVDAEMDDDQDNSLERTA